MFRNCAEAPINFTNNSICISVKPGIVKSLLDKIYLYNFVLVQTCFLF
jgi:hypothetical protein